MTTILLSIALLGQRPIPWPPATGNNGFDQYIQAAKLITTPEWVALDRDRPHVPFSQELPIAYLQREAKAAAGILDLLKRGNAMPAYDPFKRETAATLHPEWVYFKRLSVIACDMADLNAREGRPDAATDWLLTAETFAYRIPLPGMLPVLVRDAMLQRLFTKALQVLPCLRPDQIDQQITLARTIADHPVDMVRIVQEDSDLLDASIKETVADPAILGLKDEQIVDPIAFMGEALKIEKFDTKETEILGKLMSALPSGPDADPDAVKADLDKFGRTVAPADRAEYEKVLPILKAAYLPKKVSSYEIARELDDNGKAHVEAFVRALCEGGLKDEKAAFSRPEGEWGRPWKSIDSDGSAAATAMNDGKLLQWMQADFYAMYIAQVLRALGSGGGDVFRQN